MAAAPNLKGATMSQQLDLSQRPRGTADEATSRFHAVRQQTCLLVAPLSEADTTVQSMPDASPAKWHLAHTTWFFEAVILKPHLRGYRTYDPQFGFLFNSYYESFGARHPRHQRGLITRPDLET